MRRFKGFWNRYLPIPNVTLSKARSKKKIPCTTSFNGLRKAISTIARDLKKTVMVGDRHYDITGAAHFGLDSVGVLFGYGSRQELEEAGATYIAETVADLSDILL